MKVSLEWIKEYVEVNLPLSALIDKLNMIGLMVEDWEERDGDVILDIETYANRPDTLGHLGIARELAVGLGLTLKERDWPLTTSPEKTSDLVDIKILDADLCSRYCGIIVRNIKVEPSPEWLRRKIDAMDINSVNNVVDVTNYVLLSTAHPIHAFDLAKIEGKRIVIRKAQKGETLRTLEGKDVPLSPGMLVIADKKRPVALAGIMGGEESAVSETTQDVFIESAWFNPVSVRKTCKETGIQTDASYRFEREADLAFPPRAALMAASLLTQLGGKATEGIIDVYPRPKKSIKIVLRHHRIVELLGMDIDENFVQVTLLNLGFNVDVQQSGTWQVSVPLFRVDVQREADLIEEAARFYGYDKVPSTIPPLSVPELSQDKKKERVNTVRQLLFHNGFDEVINFSFSDPDKETVFLSQQKEITIRNPVSMKASRLRTSLLGGLLENISWNKNRGAEGVHIFEIGNAYFWYDKNVHEELMLSLATTGLIGQLHWQEKSEEINFFHLKGACEFLMNFLKYRPFSFQEEDHDYFEKGYSLALIYKGEKVGYIGVIKDKILDVYSLDEVVCAAEISLAKLFSKQPQSFQYTQVTKFPSVSRDISILTDRSVLYQDIKNEIEGLSIPFLEKYELYDRFSGSTIPEDKVSLSFRFVFRHSQRTLLAKEVDVLQDKIIKKLKSSFNIQLRKRGEIDK
ncbi:MAG: phenylalanine--tRNA ligase subunit beta [Candidatus Aminicenantaceae bacterium]